MNMPQTYPAAIREVVSGLYNDPAITIESPLRGKSGISRITGANNIEDDYGLYHVRFDPLANRLDFLSDFERPFVVSFYGGDASAKLASDPNVYDSL
jgi:hypothetical protein